MENSKIVLKNKNQTKNKPDQLYHFGISTESHDLKSMFQNIKVVCMGGSSNRMLRLAQEMNQALKLRQSGPPENVAKASDRYVMYKAGPVLFVNHGIGGPSVSIVLHEVVKILWHAECTNVVYFRLGTSGGLGVEPGTVVISESCMDPLLKPFKELYILGQVVKRKAPFNSELVSKLVKISKTLPDIPVVVGKTLCTDDFYEEQARTDGAICEFTEEDKHIFLKKAYDMGVRNIEMESLTFAGFTHHLGLKAVCMATTLVDRFKTDQVTVAHSVIQEWEGRLLKILIAYIKQEVIKKDASPSK